MSIIMIHEIEDWMLNLSFEKNDVLTFDDGLYSQYYWHSKFPNDKLKIYFISTNIICPEHIDQNLDFPICSIAHQRYFKDNDLSNYMKLSQIKKLAAKENTVIGLHGHNHQRLDSFDSLYDQVNFMKQDINDMYDWWEKNMIDDPTYFCWPYNKENDFYRGLLKQKYPYISFFGWERKDINEYKK